MKVSPSFFVSSGVSVYFLAKTGVFCYVIDLNIYVVRKL